MKNKLIVSIFIIVLGSGFLLGIICKDKDISFSERRKLTNYEDLREDFFSSLDDYMSDQFPVRDTLLKINAIWNREVLNNKEHNDVYVKNDSIIEKNYPMDQKSVEGFINKMNLISDKYLKNSNVYYTIIPDKSYFLEEDKELKLDFSSLINQVNSKIKYPYIDILNDFTLEDYFKTDIHLKQNAYFKVLPKFTEKMNIKYKNFEYQEKTVDNFYGASFSKVPYVKPESLTYYTNKELEDISVTHLEYGKKNVYDLSQLESVDYYNLFLSGPSALIDIENKNSTTNKELVIFRDSFASSFTPLLIPYYKKITVIDLRYISDKRMAELTSFNNKDVLFMYSTLLINSSEILKVTK